MKHFFLVSAAMMISLSVTADEVPTTINVECITKQFPTTSFLIRTEGKQVRAQVLHHNGTGYAPAISGTFTPNDLPLLTERAKIVEKLGKNMFFTWQLEKCKIYDEMMFKCFGSDEIQEVNGMKVKTFGLYTSRSTMFAMGQTFNSMRVVLSLTVDGKSIDLDMPYDDPSDCKKFP